MQEVYAAEVELSAVLEPGGFGGVKMTGAPLPHCQFSVERAYEGGESYGCVNRRFFDCSDGGSEGLRAFDLRDVLTPLADPVVFSLRDIDPCTLCLHGFLRRRCRRASAARRGQQHC